MTPEGLSARPRRRYNGKEQWVVVLDTGSFGDWLVLELDGGATEQDVLKRLTRTQKRKVKSVSKVYRRES